jgi:hypothetical protein
MKILNDHNGMVLLFVVFLFLSITIIGLSGLARSGLFSFIDSANQSTSTHVHQEIMGCVDEWLLQLQVDQAYAPAQIDILEAQCDLAVTNPQLGQRQGVFTWSTEGVTQALTVTVMLEPFTLLTIEK